MSFGSVGRTPLLWNLDSVRMNMGTGGSGSRNLAVIAAGWIRNLNVRSTSLSGTDVRLHADRVDAAMIDLARQSADDTVQLNLRSAGKIDVRTYDGDDVMHHTPPQGTNNLQVRELNFTMEAGHDALRLDGGVINDADGRWTQVGTRSELAL